MSVRRRRSSSHLLVDPTVVTEFWNLVQKGAKDECWPWTAYHDEAGYGLFYYEESMRPAHELALTFTTGEKRPERLDTCHSCDNPPCCNPTHLRFDTRQSNVDDMVRRGRNKPRTILTLSDVVLIRERLAAGAEGQLLATTYGVGEATISAIRYGERWPDAPGPVIKRRPTPGRPPRPSTEKRELCQTTV